MCQLTNQIAGNESHDLEQVTPDILRQLQLSEMTLDGYTSRLVTLSLNCLTGALTRAGVMEGDVCREATARVASGLRLLTSTVELIVVC